VHQTTGNIVVGASDSDGGYVYIYNTSGGLLDTLNIDGEPVGVYFASNGLLFVSVKSDDSPAIFAYDPNNNFQLVLTIPLSSIDTHPTGLTDYRGILYCLGQSSNSLFSFNITSGAFVNTLAQFTDSPEQLILSYC